MDLISPPGTVPLLDVSRGTGMRLFGPGRVDAQERTDQKREVEQKLLRGFGSGDLVAHAIPSALTVRLIPSLAGERVRLSTEVWRTRYSWELILFGRMPNHDRIPMELQHYADWTIVVEEQTFRQWLDTLPSRPDGGSNDNADDVGESAPTDREEPDTALGRAKWALTALSITRKEPGVSWKKLHGNVNDWLAKKGVKVSLGTVRLALKQ